jgi:ABC-type transporter Mla MlaB component
VIQPEGTTLTIHVSHARHPQGTVLKVDGHLKADDVAELSKACRSANDLNTLDLSDLQSADKAGLEILRELSSLGVQLQNASPYIKLLMKPNSH